MNKINDLLERLFNVRLIRSAPLPKKQSVHKNMVVEFFGTSGVGKSTLCNYFIERTTVKEKILQTADLVPYVRDKRVKLIGIYDALLSAKIDEVAAAPYAGFQKFNHIIYCHNVISIACMIKKYLNDKIVILDEGLFQMFGRQIQKLEDDPQLQELFDKTILIHCTASTDFIYNNIQKRAENEKIVQLFHQNQNKEELYRLVEKNVADINSFVQQLKKKGVAILEINTENLLSHNHELIEKYLETQIASSLCSSQQCPTIGG
ncbi:hypothetical protein [Sphingobacterium lumbrici]|uniref:hypothetical protein n=1 Tax=Sphingobacterium lumbrici TaxID=2559600 RepID=UPI00112A2C9A|nr:hypothetical protein [Sphingobacterium lumbrici]